MTGHCHHGGHHGGTAMGMHADQSPGWNMAMQTQRCDKELGRRLSLNDPRIIIGFTIFVFLNLLLLPYVMDYLQDEDLKKKLGEAPARPDSSGPSGAALSMVGATLFGGGVSLESALKGRGEFPREKMSENPKEPEQDQEAGTQYDAAIEAAEDPHNMPELVKESRDATVKQMLEASGMADTAPNPTVTKMPQTGTRLASSQSLSPSRGAYAQAPAAYGLAVPKQAPTQVVTPLEYGGAMPVDGEHFVYVPGQPFAQSAAPAPAAAMELSSPAQIPPGMRQAPAGQSPTNTRDPRNVFNPDTSAIVSPMGMRHHSFAPGAMTQSTGSEAGQRFKVCVSR